MSHRRPRMCEGLAERVGQLACENQRFLIASNGLIGKTERPFRPGEKGQRTHAGIRTTEAEGVGAMNFGIVNGNDLFKD